MDRWMRLAMLALVVLSALTGSAAGEVDGRFRLALLAGGIDSTQEVRTDAASVLEIVDASGEHVKRLIDPRMDAAAEGRLTIESGALWSLSAQYGLSRSVLLEGSLSWQRTDVADVEVHRLPTYQRIPAGELTRLPLHLGTLYRFRPAASFNPYAGAGIGWSFIGFEPSPELDLLSSRLDRSEGVPTMLLEDSSFLTLLQPPEELTGARVDARDTFEWYLAAGSEIGFRRNWSVLVDLRWTFASRDFLLAFNGDEGVGQGVPGGTVVEDSPQATGIYGPLRITEGGLVDANGDGTADIGLYYVEGGRLRYGGVSWLVGVRYTF